MGMVQPVLYNVYKAMAQISLFIRMRMLLETTNLLMTLIQMHLPLQTMVCISLVLVEGSQMVGKALCI